MTRTSLPGSSTDFSLLASLIRGRSASESWPLFVRKYGRLLYRWSVRWGAGSHEAEEVIQETLLAIHQKLDQYTVQPGSNFRAWLKTVAYHCWLQILQQRTLLRNSSATDYGQTGTADRVATAEARDDLVGLFERMANREIMDLAAQRVRQKVEPRSWLCFEMTYLEEMPGEEVAERLGISINAVYLTTSRLRRMIQEEVRRIDPD